MRRIFTEPETPDEKKLNKKLVRDRNKRMQRILKDATESKIRLEVRSLILLLLVVLLMRAHCLELKPRSTNHTSAPTFHV